MSKRPRRRAANARAGRVVAAVRQARGDLLALLLILAVAGGLLLRFAVLPRPGTTFAIDQPPAGVLLQGFYDSERNAAGPFRWSWPAAALIFPVSAPAEYRVTLTMQDSPAAPPGRSTQIFVNGQLSGTATLAPEPRAYPVVYRMDPRASAPARGRVLSIELQTTPFTPAGDPRQLGAILTRVEIEPSGGISPAQASLLILDLIGLALAYAAARLLGLRTRWILLVFGILLAIYLDLALQVPAEAVTIAYRPEVIAGLLLALLAPLAVSRVRARRMAAFTPVTSPDVALAPAPEARRSNRTASAAWQWAPLAAIVAVGTLLRLYRLADLTPFLGDQGRDAEIVWTMIQRHTPVLLGSGASVGGFQRGPAYYYLLLVPFWVAGGNPVAGAFLDAALDCVAIVLLYFVGRRIASPWAGLVAAGFWATAPVVLAYARMMWNPNPLPVFVLAIILALGAMMRGKGEYLVVLLPAWTIAWQLHEQSLFLLPLIAIAWFWWCPPIRLRIYAGAIGLAIVTLLPFLVYEFANGFPNIIAIGNFMVQAVTRRGAGGERSSLLARLEQPRQILDMAVPDGPFGWTALAIRLLLLLGLIAPLVHLRRGTNRRDIGLFLLWLVVPLMYAFWPGGLQVHYLLIVFPLPFLLVGLGADLARRAHRLVQLPVILGTTALITLCAVTSFALLRDSPPGTYRTTAQVVDTIVADTAGQPFSLSVPWSPGVFRADDQPYRYLFSLRHRSPNPKETANTYVVYDPLNVADGLRYTGTKINDVKIVHNELPQTGRNLLIDGDFAASRRFPGSGWLLPPRPAGWVVAPASAARIEHQGAEPSLCIGHGPGSVRSVASQKLNLEPGTRYMVRFDYRQGREDGALRVRFALQGQAGEPTGVVPAPDGRVVAASTQWTTESFTLETPPETATGTLQLINEGPGEICVRQLEVREIAPAMGALPIVPLPDHPCDGPHEAIVAAKPVPDPDGPHEERLDSPHLA